MASTILRKSTVNLHYSTPVPNTIVDLSCYAIAFEITPSTEEVDIGTFCNPSATDQGRTTFTASVTLLWEPALYTALQPHIGETGLFTFSPDWTVSGDYIRFTTKFSSQPWGRFEVGQRVEVELPLAVLDTPNWIDGALLERLGDLELPDTLPDESPELPGTLPTEPTEPEGEPQS